LVEIERIKTVPAHALSYEAGTVDGDVALGGHGEGAVCRDTSRSGSFHQCGISSARYYVALSSATQKLRSPKPFWYGGPIKSHGSGCYWRFHDCQDPATLLAPSIIQPLNETLGENR
jgi:hypothetical protein